MNDAGSISSWLKATTCFDVRWCWRPRTVFEPIASRSFVSSSTSSTKKLDPTHEAFARRDDVLPARMRMSDDRQWQLPRSLPDGRNETMSVPSKETVRLPSGHHQTDGPAVLEHPQIARAHAEDEPVSAT
ncbi:hypothetical protein QU41_00675 [Bradyrhizobium elkanii]|nr:hypothetical protein QU41_00675 [Bradyrhizobium elkanii]OJV00526.1 MAG: hypothetical protein BGO16_07615 [Nitrobacter sp. 62-23]